MRACLRRHPQHPTAPQPSPSFHAPLSILPRAIVRPIRPHCPGLQVHALQQWLSFKIADRCVTKSRSASRSTSRACVRCGFKIRVTTSCPTARRSGSSGSARYITRMLAFTYGLRRRKAKRRGQLADGANAVVIVSSDEDEDECMWVPVLLLVLLSRVSCLQSCSSPCTRSTRR